MNSQFFARTQQANAILVADDCPMMQKATSWAVHQLGHQTCVADDGLQAVELLKYNFKSIAAILMDIEMPQMNGLQASQNMRQLGFNYEHWPIIGYSSLEPDEAQDGCLKAGMNTYLQKPAQPKQLQQTIQPFIIMAKQLQTQFYRSDQQQLDHNREPQNTSTLKPNKD